ncbi:MAG: hypothetical protein FD149_844 [Rhodospirillaceae bacterium]|nr:MAG: hypothetical protein FD149_844 [Rhodospirillaceae bacterium]
MMAHSTGLSVVSQNVSNMNTAGYKRVEGLFKTALSATFMTAGAKAGPQSSFTTDIVTRTMVDRIGTMVTTNNTYDLAISGDGFFILNTETDGSGETFYTRAGAFLTVGQETGTDDTALLASSSGHALMGWAIQDDGSVATGTTLSPVIVRQMAELSGQETTSITLRGNVDANATAPQTFALPVVAPTGETLLTQTLVAQWTRDQTTPNTWTLDFIDGSGNPVVAESLAVTFNSFGQITSEPVSSLDLAWAGGETSTIALDLTDFTQFAGDTQIFDLKQDGFEDGDFQYSYIEKDGKVFYH